MQPRRCKHAGRPPTAAAGLAASDKAERTRAQDAVFKQAMTNGAAYAILEGSHPHPGKLKLQKCPAWVGHGKMGPCKRGASCGMLPCAAYTAGCLELMMSEK